MLQRALSGSGGGITEETIWTNSAPTSTFVAQAITLSKNITDYSLIRVYCRISTTEATEHFIDIDTALFQNNNTDNRWVLGAILTGNALFARPVVWNDANKIYFNSAFRLNAVGSDDNAVVPTKVTGIK